MYSKRKYKLIENFLVDDLAITIKTQINSPSMNSSFYVYQATNICRRMVIIT